MCHFPYIEALKLRYLWLYAEKTANLSLVLVNIGSYDRMSVEKLDNIDRAILRALQDNASLSQRELAEVVGLSQNACWRRLKNIQESGMIERHTVRLKPESVGLNLTVFVMVRTRHHSKEWLNQFRRTVLAIPNVIDFYRIAGDYDYMLKIMAEDMNAYDQVYQRLIEKVELDAVTSYITMEPIADQRSLPI